MYVCQFTLTYRRRAGKRTEESNIRRYAREFLAYEVHDSENGRALALYAVFGAALWAGKGFRSARWFGEGFGYPM